MPRKEKSRIDERREERLKEREKDVQRTARLANPKGNFSMKALFSGLTWGWLARRALEIGGTVIVMLGLSTEDQLPEILGAISVVAGLIWNAIGTFQPHVTAEGVKVPIEALPHTAQTTVKTAVINAVTK